MGPVFGLFQLGLNTCQIGDLEAGWEGLEMLTPLELQMGQGTRHVPSMARSMVRRALEVRCLRIVRTFNLTHLG